MGSRRIITLIGEKGDGTESISECDITNIIGVCDLSFDKTTNILTFREDNVLKQIDLSSVINTVVEVTPPDSTDNDNLPTTLVGERDVMMGGPNCYIEVTLSDNSIGKIPVYK